MRRGASCVVAPWAGALEKGKKAPVSIRRCDGANLIKVNQGSVALYNGRGRLGTSW